MGLGFTPPPRLKADLSFFFSHGARGQPKEFNGFIYFQSENHSLWLCCETAIVSRVPAQRVRYTGCLDCLANAANNWLEQRRPDRSIHHPSAVCRYIRDLLSREICRRFRVILSRCCCPSCISIPRLKGPGFNPLMLYRVAARVHRALVVVDYYTRREFRDYEGNSSSELRASILYHLGKFEGRFFVGKNRP